MSAFIVSHSLIDVLMTFASDRKTSYYVEATQRRVDVTNANATEVGRILLTENERSIYSRYADITANSDNKPGTRGQDAETYTFKRWPRAINPVSVLKACSCFDYQACESDDYSTTLAHRIINDIRGDAIRALPGYENSEGWDDFSRAPNRKAG